MSDTTNKTETQTTAAGPQTKPGFFGRIFQKLDDSMKQKATKPSHQGGCCGGKDDKGGKCC